MVFTGKDSGTAGRIMIAYKMLSLAREDILMTYGDGLSDIKIKKLINYHKQKKALITISAVRPKERYGILDIKNGRVNNFNNRKQKAGHYINGGFMVISHKVIMKLKKTSEYFEIKPMMNAIRKKKLFAFRHEKFWKSLDTLKDKNDFNKMYKENFRPWMK